MAGIRFFLDQKGIAFLRLVQTCFDAMTQIPEYGTAAKGQRELQEKLLRLCSEVEPISTTLTVLWREIEGSPLEFYMEDILVSVQPPECLITYEEVSLSLLC